MRASLLERQRMLLAFVIDPRNAENGRGDFAQWGGPQPDLVRLRRITDGLFKSRAARIRRAMPKTCAAIWLELAVVMEEFCVAFPPATIASHGDANAFSQYLVERSESLLGAPEYVGDLAKFEAAISNASAARPLVNDDPSSIKGIELFEGRFDLGPLFDRLRRGQPVLPRATHLAIWRTARSGNLRIFTVSTELYSELARLKMSKPGTEPTSPEAFELFRRHLADRVIAREAGHAD